jgi:DNA-binding NarL/FixJ family response regulator
VSEDLEQLLSALEKLTAEMRLANRRKKAAADDQRDQAAKLKALRDSPKLVSRAMASGHDLDKSVAIVAASLSALPDAIRHHWRLHERQKAARERQDRNQTIMALASRGWSNAQIAQRVKLHPHSVSRVLQTSLRQHPARTLPARKPDQ